MLKEVKEMFDEVRRKIQEITDNIKNIKEALYDSGWIETTGLFGNPVKYRKKNGVVYFVSTSGTKPIPAGTWTTIFILPEGYRVQGVNIRIAYDPAAGERFGTAEVRSTGVIAVYQSHASQHFNVSGSFPVGGGYSLALLRRYLRGGVCYA